MLEMCAYVISNAKNVSSVSNVFFLKKSSVELLKRNLQKHIVCRCVV